MRIKYGPCIKQQVGDEAERFRELAEASMLEASSRIAALEREKSKLQVCKATSV